MLWSKKRKWLMSLLAVAMFIATHALVVNTESNELAMRMLWGTLAITAVAVAVPFLKHRHSTKRFKRLDARWSDPAAVDRALSDPTLNAADLKELLWWGQYDGKDPDELLQRINTHPNPTLFHEVAYDSCAAKGNPDKKQWVEAWARTRPPGPAVTNAATRQGAISIVDESHHEGALSEAQ